MLPSEKLRNQFLEFFKQKKHAVLPSASLIPENDPSVLFTTAGMHPLVPFLLGEPHPRGKRLVNYQKCVRTNDIESVGDQWHLTFFEMLGNWSLGDYFKKEAIEWSFEFLTSKKWLGLDPKQISVSCFAGDKDAPKDTESAEHWKRVGIPSERIFFFPKSANWWGPAGAIGPCGPDTEMFFDSGKPHCKKGPGKEFGKHCNPGCDCGKFVEIWNDVFMQYNKTERVVLVDGMKCLYDENFKVNTELANILNKFSAKKILVVNGFREKGLNASKGTVDGAFSLEEKGIKKENPNYFKELFSKFNLSKEDVIYFDHSEDNVSNAKRLGIVSKVYKNNKEIEEFIDSNLYYFQLLKQKNVDTGMGLERTVAVLEGKDSNYETDLLKPIFDAVQKLSKTKDEHALVSQRIITDHLRAAVFILGDEHGIIPNNTDQGYVLRRLIRRTVRHGKLLGIEKNFCSEVGKAVLERYQGIYPELKRNKQKVLEELEKEETKFRDVLVRGMAELEKISVLDAKTAFTLSGTFGFPLEMTQEIARERGMPLSEKSIEEYHKLIAGHQELSRKGAEQRFSGGLADHSEEVIRLHTTTHLLNAALQKVLGKQVHQRGSNITKERLRFDFPHSQKMSPEEIKKVEDFVNQKIAEGLDVKFEMLPLKEALKLGAMAEFGEKYGETVKVYTVWNPKTKAVFSRELCGGPHVQNTRELGHFKIIKEEAVAAGIRRIKAVLEAKA